MRYRVWSVVNRPLDARARRVRRLLFSVSSPSEACTVIRLLQAKREEDPTIRTSEYGLEVLSADRWSEWRDGLGRDVMELMASTREEVGLRA